MALRPDQVAQLPRLFHVTPCENVASILAHGLVPAGGESQFEDRLLRPGCLYFGSREVAAENLGDYGDVTWGDAVFSVDPRDLDPALFRADEDYWRGDAMSRGIATDAASILTNFPGLDEPDSLMTQFADLPRIAYAGSIAASALRLEFLYPRQDLPDQAALRAGLRARDVESDGLATRAFLEEIAERYAWDAFERGETGLA